MNEQWYDIQGYEGLYQISKSGRVKSLSRIKYNKDKNSYFTKPRILKNNYSVTLYNQYSEPKVFLIKDLLIDLWKHL